MRVKIQFFSYLKDLAGCAESVEEIPPGTTVADLHHRLIARYPQLAPLEKSTLIAVGVEYQPKNHALKDGDEVSLFPPVQGG